MTDLTDAIDPSDPIEGFLYTFGTNRAGGTYCHIILCVLTGRHLEQFKAKGDEVSGTYMSYT